MGPYRRRIGGHHFKARKTSLRAGQIIICVKIRNAAGGDPSMIRGENSQCLVIKNIP
jgi:hypothetical protein